MLPVPAAHVGCTTDSVAASGTEAPGLITTLLSAVDVQPASLVTVKEYEPGARPERVVPDPLPWMLPPGVIFKVHVPVEGRPLSTMDPAGSAQVGWVMAPAVGAAGVAGRGFTATAAGNEIHVLSDVLLARIS